MSEEILKERLVSLDVFRGMTIAGMVLVNNPGDWGTIYGPLKHAEWHGITPTDYIFPFFLFIVGVAIAFALGKRLNGDSPKAVYVKIIRRSLIIFLLGLFLAAFPFFELGTLRIPGVLQRIAVCYLIVSLIFIHTDWKTLAAIGGVILFVYWTLMTLVPVPGCDVTSIGDKACNLAAYLDRSILGENHLWSLGKVYDPEGLLSTLPAVVTTITGVLTGIWLKTDREGTAKAAGLFFFGVSACAAGWFWSLAFPLNKALWTSSYVVYTSGLALCFLGWCYWLIDLKGYRRWSKPFVVFGMNALALYFGAELMSKCLYLIKVSGGDGQAVSLKDWIYTGIFAPVASPMNASLMYALTYVLLWLLVMWVLYRKRIFIKI